MNRIIVCVPNFSEGRNPGTIQALLAAVTSVPDVWLLDHTSDPDHHRSVLTFAGSPEAVGEAVLRAVRAATKLIDLRHHEGVHPRVGATDVVPFVPMSGVTMEQCVQLARRIGQAVASELQIPVFLYEQAASNPDHVRLEAIRQGGLPGLKARMASDPTWTPDFGPSRLHDTAGAMVIGARRPLIAFNVNLQTTDVSIAKAIAKAIRQSGGGWPCLKAIGVELPSRGMVQVAMNLTDYHVTSLYVAFHAVKRETAKYGVTIAGSELIGLVPQEALDQTIAASLHLERLDSAQVLDNRIRAALGGVEGAPSLTDFLEAVAAAKPAPAGGSVAALVGALAASLGVMGARLGHHLDAQQQLLVLCRQLHTLVQSDVEAYEEVARATNIPKETPGRSTFLSAALQKATETPLAIAESACEAGLAIHACFPTVKPAVRSDLTVGMIMAIAAAEAGLHTADANTKLLSNHDVKDKFSARIHKITRSLEELKGLCYTPPS